jgi:hypothetical protein
MAWNCIQATIGSFFFFFFTISFKSIIFFLFFFFFYFFFFFFFGIIKVIGETIILILVWGLTYFH